MVRIGEAHPNIWESIIEHLEEALKEFEFQGEDIEISWKKLANARMLERRADELLDEKYGVFKFFFTNPAVQYVMGKWEEYDISLEFLLGEPLIPFATALIILFMMHKRVSNDLLVLIAALIFNVNPIYVVGSVIIWQLSQSNRKPKQFCKPKMKSSIAASRGIENLSETDTHISYDHVLVGNDLSTLYTAAILSRNGHKCCVLQSKSVPTLEIHPDGAPCSVSVYNMTVGRADRYQILLDAVQPLDETSRVVLSPVGTVEEGYAHTVIRRVSLGRGATGSTGDISVMRSGKHAIVEDLSTSLGADKPALQSFLGVLSTLQSSMTVLLMSRVLPVQWTGVIKEASVKPFFDMIRETSDRVLQRLKDSSDVRETLYAMAAAAQEEVQPATESSACILATALSMSEEGMYYPVGGVSALQKVLCAAIRTTGGRVFTDVGVEGLEVTETKPGVCRATGVRVSVETGDTTESRVVKGTRSVVSGLGAICTYTRLLPSVHLSQSIKQSLSTLTEARPKVLVVFWLQGTASLLGLTSCDYFEMTSTGETEQSPEDVEAFVDGWVRVWSPSCKDPDWSTRYPELQTVVVELGASSQLVSIAPLKYKPASTLVSSAPPTLPPVGPRVYSAAKNAKIETTCAATSLLSGDIHIGQPLSLSKGQKDRARTKALTKLTEVYPLAATAVMHCHVLAPTLGGLSLSSTPEKFTSQIGSTADVPGLFLCGRDVSTSGLAGELQGGWVAANAVLGYGVNDLGSGRDILMDLRTVGVNAPK
mmetsp:Transcript_5301/g.5448  ORF Transcript_5301/g.5448 Transcript_5301/m.5448 type:complete len:765 (+) Transcript_5301:48-2342(+)